MVRKSLENKKLWIITLVIAFIVAFIFFLPQLSSLILAGLMAMIFYPLFKRLRRKRGHIAAVTTLIISFLIVIIPLGFVLIATTVELLHLADTVANNGTWGHLSDFLRDVSRTLDDLIAPLTGVHIDINEQSLVDLLRTNLPTIAKGLAGFVFGFVGSIPQFFVAFIVYVFVFVELLLQGPRYVAILAELSPYDKKTTERYFERVWLMANAMVKGQLIISMIISLISALLLIPLGFGQYVFIFFVLFTILNFIPLGCGIIVIPLTIYAMLTGQLWVGLIVFVLYNLAANVDTFLRPIFIPKKIQLSAALTVVATFCGIAYFGILGVVYGPIIMILLVTTISLYCENKAAAKAL